MKPINPCHTITYGEPEDRVINMGKTLGRRGLIGDIRAKFFSNLLRDKFDYVRGVEIGVDHGRFLFPLVTGIGNQIDVFYGVDPYKHFPSYRIKWDNTLWDELYVKVLQTANILNKNIIIVRMTSEEAACVLPDDFNFVYVDGKHGYYDVLTDISLWEEKIVNGGILSGHDYISKKRYEAVGKAVRHYAEEMGRDLQNFHGNWFWKVTREQDNT